MFTDSYLPARDGVTTSIVTTRKELQSLGHEVHLFAPAPIDPKDQHDDVHYFKAKAFHDYLGYTIPLYPTDKCRQLKEYEIEVIHSHGLLFQGLRSFLAARALKLPVVLTWHTMVTDAAKYYNFTPLPDGMVTRLLSIYLISLLKRADAVVAPTDAIKEELLQMSSRIRHIEVIPTGVDSSRFHPGVDGSIVRRSWGIGPEEKVVLSLGRIAKEKNLELILNGFQKMQRSRDDVHLVIAGDGPAKEQFLKMAGDLGMGRNVHFTGFVKDEELPNYYAACDVFTLASKFETQGLVVLEAMATGKPVSGINYRALAEIIHNGHNGYLFQNEPEDWAETTLRALQAPTSVRMEARRTAESFSIRKGAERLVKLYEYSIEAKKARLSGKG